MGKVFAAVFVAEIGDVSRFDDPKRLCSWAGLTPRLDDWRHRQQIGRGDGSSPPIPGLVLTSRHGTPINRTDLRMDEPNRGDATDAGPAGHGQDGSGRHISRSAAPHEVYASRLAQKRIQLALYLGHHLEHARQFLGADEGTSTPLIS